MHRFCTSNGRYYDSILWVQLCPWSIACIVYNVVSYNQPLRYSSIAGSAAAAFAAAMIHCNRLWSYSAASSYFSYEYRRRSPVVRIAVDIVFLYCRVDDVYSSLCYGVAASAALQCYSGNLAYIFAWRWIACCELYNLQQMHCRLLCFYCAVVLYTVYGLSW